MEGLVVPNADGSLIFTYSGVYTPNSVPVVKSNGTPAGAPSFFPSYHPAYFFGVPLSRWFIDTEARPKPVVIYMSGSSQPLFYLPEAFGEMFEKYDPNKGERADPIPMDKRYHFYPQFKLFLTIPPTNDKIVAHPVNVRQVLIEKGTDYLYVTSTAPEARAGAFYHYHLEAESKVGGISFALRSGPEGLVVKEDGNLGWMVPAKAVEESVIVSVKDLSGQEILHTFSIAITN